MQSKLRIERILENCAHETTILSRKLSMKHTQEWLTAFAAPVYAEHGRWILGRYLWHTFSYGYSEFDSNIPDDRLKESNEDTLIVSGDSSELWGFRTASLTTVALLKTRVDLLIFPDSYEWTIATTHDLVHGPYYARASWTGD